MIDEIFCFSCHKMHLRYLYIEKDIDNNPSMLSFEIIISQKRLNRF